MLSQEKEAEIKQHISMNLFKSPIKDSLTKWGYNLILCIMTAIKEDIKKMR